METEKVFTYRKHDLRTAKGKLMYILRQGDARPRSDSEALGTSWHFVATRCTDGKQGGSAVEQAGTRSDLYRCLWAPHVFVCKSRTE